MNDKLFDTLLSVFGTEAEIARTFGGTRVAHWKRRVPRDAAILCHLSPNVPYTYDSSVYGPLGKGLGLGANFEEITTNTEVNDHDSKVHQEAA